MSASGSCYQPGKTLTNQILTLDPTELSSFVNYVTSACIISPLTVDKKVVQQTDCHTHATYGARSFNFADLQGPLPPRVAWHGNKAEGRSEDANFIIENQYFPDIILPDQVLYLEPLWASCYPFGDAARTFTSPKARSRGVWDPPITLDGTTFLAAASIPAHRGNGAQTTVTPLPGPTPVRPKGPATKNTAVLADFAREIAAVKLLNAPS
jgi:hypothetical protein